MYKVVLNVDYGQFALSLKAVEWLEQNGSDETKEAIKDIRSYTLDDDDFLTFRVSIYFNNKRHNADLVRVVESLGEEANGLDACLEIVEILYNTYRIENNDGAERLITPEDKFNWTVIE